jgi:hypothetical protein
MIAVALAGAVAPAFANDDALDKVTQGALLPTRLGGVVVGTVVGTPIAVARESFKSYVSLTEKGSEQIHGKDCGPANLLVSVFTLPAGLVVGTVKGGYYGMKNGFMKGFETPFHPDSFSLGELDEK